MVQAERLPGALGKWVPLDGEPPTWRVNRPSLTPGHGERWWRKPSARRNAFLLKHMGPDPETDFFVLYVGMIPKRWEALTTDSAPEWAARLPPLPYWHGEQWLLNTKSGLVACTRFNPNSGSREYWTMGAAGPHQIPKL